MIDQIEFANVILINKTDTVAADELEAVVALVRKLNRAAKVRGCLPACLPACRHAAAPPRRACLAMRCGARVHAQACPCTGVRGTILTSPPPPPRHTRHTAHTAHGTRQHTAHAPRNPPPARARCCLTKREPAWHAQVVKTAHSKIDLKEVLGTGKFDMEEASTLRRFVVPPRRARSLFVAVKSTGLRVRSRCAAADRPCARGETQRHSLA